MRKIQIIVVIVGLLFSLTASAEDKTSREVETLRAYASIDGLKMYYEIHGSGTPLVLIHGGLCNELLEKMWKEQPGGQKLGYSRARVHDRAGHRRAA